MILIKCDRCGHTEETGALKPALPVFPNIFGGGQPRGGMSYDAPATPRGWRVLEFPRLAEDGGLLVSQLCDECVNDLKAFLGGAAITEQQEFQGGHAVIPPAIKLDDEDADLGPVMNPCPECGTRYAPDELTRHMQESHGGGGGRSRCPYCAHHTPNPLMGAHVAQWHPGDYEAWRMAGQTTKDDAVCQTCGKPVEWVGASRLWKHTSVKDDAGVGYGHDVKPMPYDEWERGERP